MQMGLQLKQVQTLSPHIIQSMEILQMGTQELTQHINETLQSNPALEIDESPSPTAEDTDLRQKLDWIDSTNIQTYWHTTCGAEESNAIERQAENLLEESLAHYLKAQVRFDILPPLEAALVNYLIASLDDCGWLGEHPDDLAIRFSIEKSLAKDAIAFLQSLDPAGVGARNLQECLSLQLLRRNQRGLALTIVTHHLNDVGKNHYNHIAKETGASRSDVQDACTLIRSLNPRPAGGFSSREQLSYIIPDIVVVQFEGHFELLTNDCNSPRLTLSSYYRNLYHSTDDAQVKEYLNEKLNQAQRLMNNVEQRRSTLMRCAHCLVQRQEAFFLHGVGRLQPLSLSDVAKELGVHESTVSRTVRDKYLQCTHGVFPLGYFFSRNLTGKNGGKGSSVDCVKSLLRTIVDSEDCYKPLSDQMIVQRLEQEGVKISRRTVAKYRDELGIPSTAGRKKF